MAGDGAEIDLGIARPTKVLFSSSTFGDDTYVRSQFPNLGGKIENLVWGCEVLLI